MKVEKVETIRVHIDNMFYCDVTPTTDHPGYYDFWLYRAGCGVSSYMFGCAASSEQDIVELIEANADDYIKTYLEEYYED